MWHGGRIVASALAKEDVEYLFTLCGGHIQSIYDGCLDEGIVQGGGLVKADAYGFGCCPCV